MNRHSFFLRLFLGNLLLIWAVIALLAVVARRPLEQGYVGGILAWIAIIGVGAAAVLGLLISYLWYRPLRQITMAAREIASGNLQQRVATSGAGELQQLSAALNEMRQDLAGQIALIAAQREGLQTIVANLRDGIIAVDADGRVVVANPAALDLLGRQAQSSAGQEQIIGRKIEAVVSLVEVLDLYHKAHEVGMPARRQMEVQIAGSRGQLDVHAMPIASASPQHIALLLIVYDISEITQIAAVKAEFVANASHELKTPLATLRAAVESLAMIEPSEQQDFRKLVGIIERQVNRLEDMTVDLLDLHMVETGAMRSPVERISFDCLARWARSNFDEKARSKGLSFEVNCDHASDITADRTLLELILRNLLDNAIKFTSAGGSVLLAVDQDDTHTQFAVSDTGCGIAPEMQGRVFERFFQANPSRAGQPSVRGTGLGLAIVKHAADRMGGHVDLRSALGRGTTVTLVLKHR